MSLKKWKSSIDYVFSQQLIFLVMLLGFVASKFTHLDISFFWDESWVYAPALKAMADNGPSLFPDAIALDYSRGHPLLFHFMGGIWIKIFGETNFSLHLFALSLSIVFLLFLRKLLSEFLSPPQVLIFLFLLMVQPIFYAQSSMVLPEILLALFSTAAIYYYLKKKYFLYILFGVLAMLTKETAIVLICSVTLYGFIINLKHKNSFLTIFKQLLIGLFPFTALIAHMLYLKLVFGWFLYPEHTGMMNMSLSSVLHRSLYILNDLIFAQNRYIITIPFVLYYSFRLVKTKLIINYIFLTIAFALSIILFIIFDKNYGFPFIFFLIMGHFFITSYKSADNHEQPLVIFGIFIIAFIVFSSINFYTVRYLLSIFPFVLLIPVYYGYRRLSRHPIISIYLITSSIIFIYGLITPRLINDINLTYLHYCPAQSEIVKFMEDTDLYNEEINTQFLMYVALKDFNAGYRNTKKEFNYVNSSKENGKDYYIFYNTEPTQLRDNISTLPNASLLKRIENRHVWFEVWELEP